MHIHTLKIYVKLKSTEILETILFFFFFFFVNIFWFEKKMLLESQTIP